MTLPLEVAALFTTTEMCGSRVTCDPPPTDTDEDWLCLVEANKDAIARLTGQLTGFGYRLDGDEHYQIMVASDFASFKNGEINLIVTSCPDFHRKHRVATTLCKRLNLMVKADHVALFQAVLYGNAPT